jgi:hypothetical protein
LTIAPWIWVNKLKAIFNTQRKKLNKNANK